MEIHAGLCRLLPRLHRPAGPIGLEAQRSAVAGFVGVRELVAEFTEVESGKRNDRPQLAATLELCWRQRAMLVIAKLDRLARNVAFIANLMEAGVEFTAVDMPSANKLTLHILSAVAEHKREMISARTKAALAAGARREVGPTRPGDPAHARGPIGQPRRLARCRTQPGIGTGHGRKRRTAHDAAACLWFGFRVLAGEHHSGRAGCGTNPRPASNGFPGAMQRVDHLHPGPKQSGWSAHRRLECRVT
jgi:hypothetical protein